jgi:hypothetical protein
VGLDGYYYDKRRFEVYTYNNPVLALSEFKPKESGSAADSILKLQ